MIYYQIGEFMNTPALKGSQYIVFEKLRELLNADRQPSVTLLSQMTHYHETTVKRTLADLRDLGLIDYHQERPGVHATYEILEV